MQGGWIAAIAAAAGLAALAGCEPYAQTIPTTDRAQLVAPSMMPDACKRAASQRYAQLVQNLFTGPAERAENGTYVVRGQYAAYNGTRTFQCRFTSDGNLVNVYRA